MLRRFGHREDGCDARIGAVRQRCPLVPSAHRHCLREALAQHRPSRDVELTRQVLAVEPGNAQPLGVELRLEASDGDPLAVGGAVGVVERRARVEQVDPRLLAPHADRRHRVEEGHEQGRTIDHRGIDGLALSRALGMPQRGEHADKQQHGAAAVVADKVEGRCRRLVTSPDVRKHASHGDVVEVVPGRACPGPVLTPPRHPSVDQRRPAREASVGREPEPLHYSGPESFDEHVRLRDEVEDEIAACFLPDVDDDTRAAAARDVAHRIAERQAGPG